MGKDSTKDEAHQPHVKEVQLDTDLTVEDGLEEPEVRTEEEMAEAWAGACTVEEAAEYLEALAAKDK
jgi:hypothetical protein